MRHGAWLVLAVSGIVGFRVGFVAIPEWQSAVETAQVLAGVVPYPEPTPFFLYQTKAWTLLDWVLGHLLRMGVSEVHLSLILSGVLSMVSFQALSLLVFALSEDVLLACGAPLIIWISRASDFGVVGPIMAGSAHTSEVLGLSLCALVIGLFGAGCVRSGAFLLGLAPVVHPSWGILLFVVVGICFLWDLQRSREVFAQGLGYFVAGCLIFAVSLMVHEVSAFPSEAIDLGLARRYLTAFATLWDNHRQPLPMGLDGLALNRAALAVALLWLIAFKSDLPQAATFLLRVFVVTALLSLVFAASSWIPAEKLPAAVLVLIPARLANFNAMTFVALLLGLIGAHRARAWSAGMTLLFALGLLISERSMLWGWLEERGTVNGMPQWATWFDVWLVIELVSLALIVLSLRESRSGGASAERAPTAQRLRLATNGARAGLLILLGSLGLLTWEREAPRVPSFDNYATNPVFQEASKAPGLLLSSGNLDLVQLRTRRPILLDGDGLDELAFSLDAGPQTERILRDVYAIDFFNPPEGTRQAGGIPSRHNQQVWEQFTAEKWAAIKYLYKVTQVLTLAGWDLHLPIVAQDRELRLYQIPD